MMDWKDALKNLADSGVVPQAATESRQTPQAAAPAAHHGKLHIAVERKGRGGKPATIIYGFNGPEEELQQLAKTLKQRLGRGGSARGGEILIQGDSSSEVKSLLQQLGYTV